VPFAHRKVSEREAMRQILKDAERYRDWRIVVFTGALGFAVMLAVTTIINAYSLTLTSPSIALAAAAGSLLSICLLGLFSAWRVQLKFLAAESCNEMQGYFVGRPKPIADYAELVGRRDAPKKRALAATG
jgi:hypothetical protein